MISKVVLTGFILVGVLWANPLAQTVEPRFTHLYPRIAFEGGWKASVVAVNVDQAVTNVRLFAYNAGGALIQEASGGLPLDPGERRVYSSEDGDWPQGTSSLKMESESPLLSFVVLESTDGKGLEAILPVTTPNSVLTFPLIEKGTSWWSQLALLNAGAVETWPDIVALDREGNPLAQALLPSLSPMASVTVVVGDLFDSSILASTAIVQVVADQPLAGVQLSGSEDRTDVASVSAPLGLGQELFLPVFQEGGGIPLWSMVGLFNPRDGSVNVTVEAFDSQQRSLGRLAELTSLNGLSSYFFSTRNIGGALPPDTVSLAITADQPISGYAVIGALDAQGLTAAGALTENDTASDYELVGSSDGNVLAAVPLVVTEDGNVESFLGDLVDPAVGSLASTVGTTSDTESDQSGAIQATADTALMSILQGTSFTFTNDPLTSQVTPVKAIHITELRQAIDTLRLRNGLSAFSYTDSTLTPGVTPIRAVHVTELRTALNGVYNALRQTRPTYTDPTIVPTQTVIKRAHIAELRSAVREVDLFTLTVNKAGTGSGTVTGSQAGINCGATCTATFAPGTSVTLTATPAAGSIFAGWSGGGCSGTGTCTVTMNSDITVTATFNTGPPPPPPPPPPPG